MKSVYTHDGLLKTENAILSSDGIVAKYTQLSNKDTVSLSNRGLYLQHD